VKLKVKTIKYQIEHQVIIQLQGLEIFKLGGQKDNRIEYILNLSIRKITSKALPSAITTFYFF
jgi:hypothetical protein